MSDFADFLLELKLANPRLLLLKSLADWSPGHAWDCLCTDCRVGRGNTMAEVRKEVLST